MTNLKDTEKQINEIKQKIAEIKSDEVFNEQFAIQSFSKEKQIFYLQSELDKFETRRKFLLDRRNSWLPKTTWNVLVPIIVSVVSTIVILYITKNLFSPEV